MVDNNQKFPQIQMGKSNILKMKNNIALILIAILYFTVNRLHAQELEQPEAYDSIYTYSNLPTDEQRLAWNDMSDEWLHNYFCDCLKQNNIKMSCAHCASIYLTVDFKIDSNGKVTNHRIVKENKCGKSFNEKLRQCFLDFFLHTEFPASLRNIVFEINIGNGLKC